MAGTKEGGIKARDTNKERHGKNYYKDIGRQGGRNGRTGGFFNKELASKAGKKGGARSRKGLRFALERDGKLYYTKIKNGKEIIVEFEAKHD